VVASCAMIQPGISGAYILSVLGLCLHLTDILRRLPHGDVTARDRAATYSGGWTPRPYSGIILGAGAACGEKGKRTLRKGTASWVPGDVVVLPWSNCWW
jgi:hypothetical protein